MKSVVFIPMAMMIWMAAVPGYAQSVAMDCSDILNATNDSCIPSNSVGASAAVAKRNTTDPAPASSDSSSPVHAEGHSKTDRLVYEVRQSAATPDLVTEFQQFVSSTTGSRLPIYGADLFKNVPSTFAPADHIPVTSDYVLGPEDELRIRIWGQVTYSDNLSIDRSGNIYLPLVGSLHVAGLKYSEVDRHLRTSLGHLYRNFDLSVDLDHIRSVQVYVTGQARRPGMFTVSSLSTLVDALFASGGPSPLGSFRHVLLKRQGETVADFDLYKLLAFGDKSSDVRLQPEDVIYIPPSGPQAAISGSIRTAAIYELRDKESVNDLIEYAGRTTVLSSNARLSIERVDSEQRRHAIEFALDKEGEQQAVRDGDILTIFQILPRYRNTVTLRGAVANPGHFSWHNGMHLSNIIPDRDSLMSRNYWWKRNELKIQPSQAFSSDDDLNISRQKTNAHSSIALATDRLQTLYRTAPEIDWNYAVIERMDPETLRSSLISFDLGKLVNEHDNSQDLELNAGDSVTIYSQADFRVPVDQQTKYVELEGEVVNAGIYSVHEGETLRDIVQRAGGITKKAYLYGAEFSRESTRLLQQARIDEYARSVELEMRQASMSLVNYSASAAGSGSLNAAGINSAQDSLIDSLSRIKASGRIVLEIPPNGADLKDIPAIDLENGDRLIVPPVPKTVNVVGAVYDQNSFIYDSTRPAGRYLQLAGGLNRNADGRRAYVIRADGSVMNRNAARGGAFNRLHLNPGDTIVVPNKNLRPNTTLRSVMDWSQSFSQLAIGAATVSLLK